VKVSLVITPLRRLEGISYWVIDDSDGIYDFINTEVRKEWEFDVKTMPGDPASGVWLATLARRKWRLEIVRSEDITLDESIMDYVETKTGLNFAERLAKRRQELRTAIELWGRVIWPIVIRKDDMHVLDGYCRFTTLVEMKISKVYAYLGSSQGQSLSN
jgi:hypothetical protein